MDETMVASCRESNTFRHPQRVNPVYHNSRAYMFPASNLSPKDIKIFPPNCRYAVNAPSGLSPDGPSPLASSSSNAVLSLSPARNRSIVEYVEVVITAVEKSRMFKEKFVFASAAAATPMRR